MMYTGHEIKEMPKIAFARYFIGQSYLKMLTTEWVNKLSHQ